MKQNIFEVRYGRNGTEMRQYIIISQFADGTPITKASDAVNAAKLVLTAMGEEINNLAFEASHVGTGRVVDWLTN